MANIRTLKLNLLADTTDFANGIKRASGQTEGFGKQVARNMKIAAVAAAGLAVAFGVDAVKAAAADQKSQKQLQVALRNTTRATDKQVASAEKWITAQQFAYGIADDKLRPALAKLVRVTGDVKKSQDLLSLAIDVSAGSGKDLETVTNAISRAQQGNLAGLKKLGVPLDDTIIKNKDLAKALQITEKRFKGAAKQGAETLSGKMAIFNQRMGEAKESIGTAIIEALQPMADKWLPRISTGIGYFIDGLTGKNDNGGLKGAIGDNQEAIYNLGRDITGFFKTLKDNEELLKRIATVIGAIFIGAKAAGAASAMGAAIKTLIPVFRTVTVAAGATAAAEAAATGGASLAVAAPAIIGIATALSLGGLAALYTWTGKKKDYKKDFANAKQPGSGVSVAQSTAEDLANINANSGYSVGPEGTHKVVNGIDYYWDAVKRKWYSADLSGKRDYSVQPKSITGPSNFRARNSSSNSAPMIINLNGIVDGESARRSIERVLQQSSIRTGAVNINGVAL